MTKFQSLFLTIFLLFWPNVPRTMCRGKNVREKRLSEDRKKASRQNLTPLRMTALKISRPIRNPFYSHQGQNFDLPFFLQFMKFDYRDISNIDIQSLPYKWGRQRFIYAKMVEIIYCSH